MKPLLTLPDRQIYYLEGHPTVFYIQDKQVGGILVNTPSHSESLQQSIGEINYIFLPSHFGAHDLEQWQQQTGAKILAHEYEADRINGPVDIRINRQYKLSRTIDFVLMAGRTAGSCALLLKNKPGVIFFGPALEHDQDGWPQLLPHDDDQSWENRLMGSLGLQDLSFNYAFCDNFTEDRHQFGPDADKQIQQRLQQLMEND